jgi:hypothetical protein
MLIGGYFAYKRGMLDNIATQLGLPPSVTQEEKDAQESASVVKNTTGEADEASQEMEEEATKAGLDPAIIEGLAEQFGGVSIGGAGKCMFKATNGVCKPGFTYNSETKCCELNESDPIKRSQIMKDIAKEVGMSIAITEGAKFLVKGGGKLSAKFGSKVVSRAIGKVSGKLAVKAGVKAGVMAAKMGAKAAMGPVGWAMMAFDIVSMALDFADVGGYATFTANSVNTRTRNALEFQMEKIARENGMDYPMLFPVGDAFSEEYDAVTSRLSGHFMNDILADIAQKSPKAIEELMEAAVSAEETGDDFEIPDDFLDKFEESYKTVVNGRHLERDKFIYDEMIKILPSEKKDHIENFTHMSKPNRVGVSLSSKGADAWNAKNKNEFLEKFDAIKPQELPEDYQQPMVAVYTKNYRETNRSNPGKADNPNMVSRTLSQPATLGGYYGTLISYCEKPRKTSGQTINMYDYGVRFDPNTGTCRFTQAYCSKMGLKFDGNGDTDCKNRPGQKVAEMIFGTTVTRGAIKTANKAKKKMKQNFNDITSGDPKRMVKGAFNAFTDPLGVRGDIAKTVKGGAKKSLKNMKRTFNDITSGNPSRMAGAAFRAMTSPYKVPFAVAKKILPRKVTGSINKAAKKFGKAIKKF